MDQTDIRWKQRFQNYEKALQLLEAALWIKTSSIVERAGVVRFFEMSFDLAWNT